MKFQTLYDFQPYSGEVNDGTLHVVPNEALSPKEILRRFVRDMPVPATSVESPFHVDNLDVEPLPAQGQEYDPLELQDELIELQLQQAEKNLP